MGTTTEVVPVVQVDGSPIGSGKPGPIARRLHEAYVAAVRNWLASKTHDRSESLALGGRMSSEESLDDNDPFAAHYHREPLTGAGVRIVLLTESPAETAAGIVAPIVTWLEAEGRCVEVRVMVLDRRLGRRNEALGTALEGATLPLVLVTTAEEPWSARHLTPLLEAISLCDHVVGSRPGTTWPRIRGGSAACRAGSSSRCRSSMSTRPASYTDWRSWRRSAAAIGLRPFSMSKSWPRRRSWRTCSKEVGGAARLRGWTSRRGWLGDPGPSFSSAHCSSGPGPKLASGPAEDRGGPGRKVPTAQAARIAMP